MAMYEVGTVTGAASQARVTGTATKWSQVALGILPGSILVVYRSGSAGPVCDQIRGQRHATDADQEYHHRIFRCQLRHYYR